MVIAGVFAEALFFDLRLGREYHLNLGLQNRSSYGRLKIFVDGLLDTPQHFDHPGADQEHQNAKSE